jgi:hypothetical protein
MIPRVNQVVSDNRKIDEKHFCLENYPHKYIHRFKFDPIHKIEENAFTPPGGAGFQINNVKSSLLES